VVLATWLSNTLEDRVMPYKTVSEAEKTQPGLSKYSAKAKRGWLDSFNSSMEKDNDESKAFAVAYSVANKVDGKKASQGCKYCGGEILERCRCPSRMTHSAEQLEKGHGVLCEHGHRYFGETLIQENPGLLARAKYWKERSDCDCGCFGGIGKCSRYATIDKYEGDLEKARTAEIEVEVEVEVKMPGRYRTVGEVTKKLLSMAKDVLDG